ncbi:MAG: dihydroorotase [Candidatus Aminicenantaceae bacterium]
MRLLIKNGRVIDPASATDETLDILIEKKKIIAIETKLDDDAARTIDASHKVVAPGFIDMHVHLRDPGYEHKETIKTGSLAAARGGFTTIACMPNTSPINDNQEVTKYIVGEARKNAVVNVLPIAAITMGEKGEELTEMGELLAAGAVAFSDDGQPVANSQIMRRALEYARQFRTVIIDHCEDKSLSVQGVMNEGAISYRLGLKGIPASSEEVMVARDLILAEKADAGIHLAHLSTRGSVELVRQAKARGVKVTAEVAPHHLVLDDSLLEGYDTHLKVNPPLRSLDDVRALQEGARDGTIDVIATDHAPHSPDEKAVEFDLAPFGINGLETAVSLILDRLVRKKILPLKRFIEMLSTVPARILHLDEKGKIEVGADADLTILALNQDTIVDMDRFRSRSRNSPLQGWKLKGAADMTIVGGRIIYP